MAKLGNMTPEEKAAYAKFFADAEAYRAEYLAGMSDDVSPMGHKEIWEVIKSLLDTSRENEAILLGLSEFNRNFMVVLLETPRGKAILQEIFPTVGRVSRLINQRFRDLYVPET